MNFVKRTDDDAKEDLTHVDESDLVRDDGSDDE